eukprot:14164018-Alexandrium_andersonii.AAC.1
MAEYQMRCGRYFLFEQPDSAASWQLPELLALGRDQRVLRAVSDQCRFGLSVVDSGQLSKKPTGWLTNSQKVAEELDVRCRCDQPHATLLSGLPRKAQ